MEKLLEYTRYTFEERYLDEKFAFYCLEAQVKKGYGRCICIPGVAINYIMKVLSCCFGEFKDNARILWNKEKKRYYAESTYQDKLIAINFLRELGNCMCYFSDEWCSREINEYAYLRIRAISTLKTLHWREQKESWERSEALLFGKISLFNNGEDYLRLFIFICDEYRFEFEMDEYAEKLFRLFLFLFPYTGLKTIENNISANKGDTSFTEYNKAVLEDYKQLGKNVKMDGLVSVYSLTQAAQYLTEFLGFNFWNVCERFEDGEHGDKKDMDSILRRQFTIISNLENRIDSLVKRL